MSKPKSLLYYCQLKLYYELYRILSLIINDAHWYCFCKKVPGCCRENLIRDWCLICFTKIESKKTIKYLDKVKKDSLKMLKIYNVLNTELKKIYDYNPYKKLWQGEYVCSGRDIYSR